VHHLGECTTIPAMSLGESTIPQVLYKIPNPQSNPTAELYSVNATILPTATDPVKRWVMKEIHGWWDEETKTFLNQVTTFLPNETKHAVSIDEALEQVKAQILVRVRSGFKYQMEWNPMTYPDFDKYEWSLDGTRKEYK